MKKMMMKIINVYFKIVPLSAYKKYFLVKNWRLIAAVKKIKNNLMNLLKNRNITHLNRYHLNILQEDYSENENEKNVFYLFIYHPII